MKEVRAYIKPFKLDVVLQALSGHAALSGLSWSRVEGVGRGRGGEAGAVAHVRLELFCRDADCAALIELIRSKAHTGLRGDGKIYVLDVSEAVRISTGERGDAAV